MACTSVRCCSNLYSHLRSSKHRVVFNTFSLILSHHYLLVSVVILVFQRHLFLRGTNSSLMSHTVTIEQSGLQTQSVNPTQPHDATKLGTQTHYVLRLIFTTTFINTTVAVGVVDLDSFSLIRFTTIYMKSSLVMNFV